jgi:hypothetical protein
MALWASRYVGAAPTVWCVVIRHIITTQVQAEKVLWKAAWVSYTTKFRSPAGGRWRRTTSAWYLRWRTPLQRRVPHPTLA